MLNKELISYTYFATSDVNLFPILRVHWDSSLLLKAFLVVEVNMSGTWIQLPSITGNSPNELYSHNLINAYTLNAMLIDDLPDIQYVSGSSIIDSVEKSIIYAGSCGIAIISSSLDTNNYRITITFTSLNEQTKYNIANTDFINPNLGVTCKYDGQHFLITTNGNPVYTSYIDCQISFN